MNLSSWLKEIGIDHLENKQKKIAAFALLAFLVVITGSQQTKAHFRGGVTYTTEKPRCFSLAYFRRGGGGDKRTKEDDPVIFFISF